jgi:drug/metabolite transporter (DMT)-like permease
MKLNRGILAALGAAALFGLSTPIAKTLVGEVAPLLLAGLLYVGSGLGLAVLLGLRAIVHDPIEHAYAHFPDVHHRHDH